MMRLIVVVLLLSLGAVYCDEEAYTSLFDFDTSRFYFSPAGLYFTDSIPGYSSNDFSPTSATSASPASPFSFSQTGSKYQFFSPGDFEFNSYQLDFFSPAQKELSPHELYDSSDVSSEFFDSGFRMEIPFVLLSVLVIILF